MPLPLADAFGIGPREVVTIVGSGGKTTTLYRLARELQQRDGRVVITTTTHIMAPDREPDLVTIAEIEPDLALARCAAALAEGRIAVLGTRLTPDGRLAGVAPDVVDACARRADVNHVVVEADGAGRKTFKAPLAYEPVVPASTTLLVAVVGADALGLPLQAEHIHRPERVAELSGAVLGQPVTAETIAAVLLHRLGPLRDAPAAARTLILVNKADTPERSAAARTIAAALQVRNGPRVFIGAVATDRTLELTGAPRGANR
jgi:probable selenium-dependent hydroxylase accessory protein YqeC